jgi:hypothetical protein
VLQDEGVHIGGTPGVGPLLDAANISAAVGGAQSCGMAVAGFANGDMVMVHCESQRLVVRLGVPDMVALGLSITKEVGVFIGAALALTAVVLSDTLLAFCYRTDSQVAVRALSGFSEWGTAGILEVANATSLHLLGQSTETMLLSFTALGVTNGDSVRTLRTCFVAVDLNFESAFSDGCLDPGPAGSAVQALSLSGIGLLAFSINAGSIEVTQIKVSGLAATFESTFSISIGQEVAVGSLA